METTDVIKKSLIGIAIVIGLYVLSTYVQGYFWEKEAARYMEDVLLEIARPWRAEPILVRASLALKASGNERMVQRVEAGDAVLGNFVRVREGPSCKLLLAVDSYSKEKFTYAACKARVEFEKKTASMNMRLVEQSKEWRIDDFTIDK